VTRFLNRNPGRVGTSGGQPQLHNAGLVMAERSPSNSAGAEAGLHEQQRNNERSSFLQSCRFRSMSRSRPNSGLDLEVGFYQGLPSIIKISYRTGQSAKNEANDFKCFWSKPELGGRSRPRIATRNFHRVALDHVTRGTTLSNSDKKRPFRFSKKITRHQLFLATFDAAS
jgi:hypothetical protein